MRRAPTKRGSRAVSLSSSPPTSSTSSLLLLVTILSIIVTQVVFSSFISSSPIGSPFVHSSLPLSLKLVSLLYAPLLLNSNRNSTSNTFTATAYSFQYNNKYKHSNFNFNSPLTLTSSSQRISLFGTATSISARSTASSSSSIPSSGLNYLHLQNNNYLNLDQLKFKRSQHLSIPYLIKLVGFPLKLFLLTLEKNRHYFYENTHKHKDQLLFLFQNNISEEIKFIMNNSNSDMNNINTAATGAISIAINNGSNSFSDSNTPHSSSNTPTRTRRKPTMSPPPEDIYDHDASNNANLSPRSSNSHYSYENHISANSLKMRYVVSSSDNNKRSSPTQQHHNHSHSHFVHNFHHNRNHRQNHQHVSSSPRITTTSLSMSKVDMDMDDSSSGNVNLNNINGSSPKVHANNQGSSIDNTTKNDNAKGFTSFIMGKNENSKRRKAAKTILSAFSSKTSSSSSSSPNHNNDNNSNKDNKSSSSPSLLAKPMAATKEEKIKMSILQQENQILKQTIHQLTQENDVLKNTTMQLRYDLNNLNAYSQQKLQQIQKQQQIVIEQFEGEGLPFMNEFGEVVDPKSWWERNDDDNDNNNNNKNYQVSSLQAHRAGDLEGQIEFTPLISTQAIATTSSSLSPGNNNDINLNPDLSCDEYEDGACPIEPHLTFQDALRDRAYWLVGLLTLQSMSGFILQRNEELLQSHPIIVYFLTMLVGAGGNAGNQAAVRVIRGIALGTLNDKTQKQFLSREFKMAIALSAVLSLAGFIRAIAFRTPVAETIAVTSALALIVFTSICFGAVLPILLKKIRIDPAHSSTSIQVIMDILGVLLTVLVSTTILDSPFGTMLVSKLSGSS